MIASIVVCVPIGMAVGLRFKAFFVLPLSLATIGVVVVVEAAPNQSTWMIIAAAIDSVISLQIGYLVGSFAVGGREQVKAQETADRNCNSD